MLIYMVGTSRSGSTWLYNRFVEHPQITQPDFHADGNNKSSSFWKRDINFIRRLIKDYKLLCSGEFNSDLTDGSGYIPEENILELKKAFPQAKLIYCVRNPIKIFWSHVNFISSQNMSLEVLKMFKDSPDNYYDNTRHDLNITRWEKIFEREIYKYFFTDIRDNPQKVLDGLADYIGVEPWQIEDKKLKEKVNISKASIENKIPDEYLEWMNNNQKSNIEWCENYFKKDLSHWRLGQE
ncbi:MAG: sulfotransferase [Magnetococcales bacterium]|nr:sulfotransferase [Magnetococcales bacterium]